jgi:hypothetical protein
MQWFLQVVDENDPRNAQSGALSRPDWGYRFEGMGDNVLKQSMK